MYPYNVHSQQNRARALLLYIGYAEMRRERDKYKRGKVRNLARINRMGDRIGGYA